MASLLKQYSDSKNFMARVELNRKFGTNPYKWTLWLFDQMQFKKDDRILELGCGNAILWKSNLQKIPEDAHILLSDFSKGMLDDARGILGDAAERFEYDVIDAELIPYPDDSFDIIIANLMLYHIPDRKKAISEISRVLKSDGTFYATTFGLNYMKELSDLVSNYDKKINCSLEPFARAFGLENGEKQLSEHFEDIKLMKYRDGLEVTEAEPLLNYVLSFTNVNELINEGKVNDFSEYITNTLNKSGKIQIEKESGAFIAKEPY